MNKITPYRVQPFHNTTAGWASDNTTILALGELGIEDTGFASPPRLKLGDGVSIWSSLAYVTGGSVTAGDGTYLGIAIPSTNPGAVVTASYFFCTTPGNYVNFPTSASTNASMPTSATIGILKYITSTGFWTYTTLATPTSSTIPTLEAVTLAGNTTDQPIIVTGGAIGTVQVSGTNIVVGNLLVGGNQTQVLIGITQIDFIQTLASVVKSLELSFSVLTSNRLQIFQDASGVIALTDPRVETAASYTTSHTINSDNIDESVITAQTGALLFNNPTGTIANRRKLVIYLKDNSSSHAITWDTKFIGGLTCSLPSTTNGTGKSLIMEFAYYTEDTTWHLLGTNQE